MPYIVLLAFWLRASCRTAFFHYADVRCFHLFLQIPFHICVRVYPFCIYCWLKVLKERERKYLSFWGIPVSREIRAIVTPSENSQKYYIPYYSYSVVFLIFQWHLEYSALTISVNGPSPLKLCYMFYQILVKLYFRLFLHYWLWMFVRL